MNPSNLEILATVFFALAIIHTFSVHYFAKWAEKYPKGSLQENVLHFLAEIEVVFGLWAAALFVGIAAMEGSVDKAVYYIESLNYTEPKFVLVVMVVAATRPIVMLGEFILNSVSRMLPFKNSKSFYITALAIGPLLGSFITEPAAMTLLALMLKRRYFDRGISMKFAYVTLGLLFVNVSIGGTLTHFAAPPVLMVANTWGWDTPHMLMNFGWRAALSTFVSTFLVAMLFRNELNSVEEVEDKRQWVPAWLTTLHILFLVAVIYFAHHPDVFFGVLMLFLGLTVATREYQDNLRLREGLLVGFFLAGLVTLGSLQNYWLKPLIESLDGSALFVGTLCLSPFTDNAAMTYLGSLVEGITPEQQYAIVSAAICGGGMSVIANAPNPAGVGILQSSKVFDGRGISPLNLFLGALIPTLIAVACFWFI